MIEGCIYYTYMISNLRIPDSIDIGAMPENNFWGRNETKPKHREQTYGH